MSTVKRYLFENRNFDPDYDPDADHSYDFDADEEEPELNAQGEASETGQEDREETEEEEIAAPPPTFSEEEVLSAQQTAFDEGKAAGIQEANAQFEHLIATALTQLAQSVPAVFDQHGKEQQAHTDLALKFAHALARKILPAYSRKHGVDEIQDMVAKCMDPLRSEPRIMVKVHVSLRDDLQEKLEKIAQEQGFDGKLVIMGSEDIVPGDCRVEWSEGGAERNSAQIWEQIDEILERNLTHDTNQGETQTEANGEHPSE